MPQTRLSLLAAAAALISLAAAPAARADDYAPGAEWRRSSPEAQGMDSRMLAGMVDGLLKSQAEIRGLVVVRHGWVVLESYRYPFDRQRTLNVKSVTKSVLSALTGIAQGEGLIGDVDQPIAGFLPGLFTPGADPRKGAITLGNALTMTAGLKPVDQDNGAWARSRDWARFTVDRPLIGDPGTRFDYNTGLPQLMARIIASRSGMSVGDYARAKLFEPLGIQPGPWTREPVGTEIGGSELCLRPLDMARLGYLYLHGGLWGTRRVVPEEWIRESTRAWIPFKDGAGYGFWWWITPDDYQARGWGGQYIIVNRKLDMVVAVTAADFQTPTALLMNAIYPAARSDDPLPPDAEARAALDAAVAALAAPEPSAVPAPLALIREISGKRYRCAKNGLGLGAFALAFHDARCRVTWGQESIDVPCGPDGGYDIIDREGPPSWFGERPVLPLPRTGRGDRYQVAVRGRWTADNVFLVEWYNYLAEPVKFAARFTFSSNTATVEALAWPTGWTTSGFTGTAVGRR
jgi:CubicO group peptidase (beta-lactamase class C family)